MKKIINIYLASPRGFCAGVKRAIEIVELALQKYGPPIYVRHEIVHNKRVVQELRKKGAVFVEELEEIPLGSRVIFSAHGVSKKIKKVAKDYKHLTLDATCPLVSKVHKQTEKYFNKDYKIILIGGSSPPPGTPPSFCEGASAPKLAFGSGRTDAEPSRQKTEPSRAERKVPRGPMGAHGGAL